MTGWTEAPDEIARQLDDMALDLMTLQETVAALTARLQALETRPVISTGLPTPVFVPRTPGAPKGRAGTAQHDNQTVLALVESYAAANNLNPALIVGKCREQLVSEVRQEIMHKAEIAGVGRTAIGRALGGRDHATVAHGIRVHMKKGKTT